MKTAIFLVVLLLAMYRANGVSMSPNMYQDPANESGDMSFSQRGGGPVVSTAKYPFMALVGGPTMVTRVPCFIVNKYFCIIAGAVGFPTPDQLPSYTVTTGVEDTISSTFLGSVHSVTGGLQHPSYSVNTADFQLSVIKACPPYTESAFTLPAKDAVLAVDTVVVVVGYTIFPDINGKKMLREVTTKVVADSVCTTAMSAMFVVGKSICLAMSVDSTATYVEQYSIVLSSDGKAYGAVVSKDFASNAAVVQPFSTLVDWITTNTTPFTSFSLSPNTSEQLESENGEVSFRPRVGGPAASPTKYPFVSLVVLGLYFTPCFIVNKYFCIGVGNPLSTNPDYLKLLTVKTGVEDAGSGAVTSTSEHVITGAVVHPNLVLNVAEHLLSVLKVCPPFTEVPLTFPAKDEILNPGSTTVLAVAYTANADEEGKFRLREVSASIVADAACLSLFEARFVAGKSICITFSQDGGTTKVEVTAIVLANGKAYGGVVQVDEPNNVALVQAFSHDLNWIAASTKPL